MDDDASTQRKRMKRAFVSGGEYSWEYSFYLASGDATRPQPPLHGPVTGHTLLRKLMMHIDVKFIPPYCYHLSPLDNGAFGCAPAPFQRTEKQHLAP